MCLCEQTAVHIYDSQQSLLHNLVGWQNTQWLTEQFGPPLSGRFTVDCPCADAYLPAAMGAGVHSLIAIAVAIGVGAALAVRPKLAAILAALWILIIAAGIHADYSERVDWAGHLADSRRSAHAEYLASYVHAVPVQFLVDALILLALPAGLTLAITRLLKGLNRTLAARS